MKGRGGKRSPDYQVSMPGKTKMVVAADTSQPAKTTVMLRPITSGDSTDFRRRRTRSSSSSAMMTMLQRFLYNRAGRGKESFIFSYLIVPLIFTHFQDRLEATA